MATAFGAFASLLSFEWAGKIISEWFKVLHQAYNNLKKPEANMKRLWVSLILLSSFYANASLEGLWEGTCESFDDGLFYVTFNYQFINEEVDTFLQYYEDKDCSPDKKQGTTEKIKGSYQANRSHYWGPAYSLYSVSIDLGQGLTEYSVHMYNGQEIEVCDVNACRSYKRAY